MTHTTEHTAEDEARLKKVQDLLDTENEQLAKLHEILEETIDEKELLTLVLAEHEPDTISKGQKAADKVAAFGGSWKFIILFGVILFVWIILNAIVLSNREAFDPYPFILLNLILSCIAALQAPVIMMSQNRKDEKDRKRAQNDYLINLKAELEIKNMHKKIDLLMVDQMKTLLDLQKLQVEILTNIEKVQKNEKK